VGIEAIADSIKLLATLSGVIVIAYSGFMLAASQDPVSRSQWKEVILGVIIGLSIVYLAPIIASVFTGGSYCG
jgi:type IV secretory pathway VirB2 component (pilin)